MTQPRDDLGVVYRHGPPRRVVSLVPSATETIALAAPRLLVGVTDYCTRPPNLDRPRVGGSKYPRIDRVLECRPDLVVMNAEENRRRDAEALRAAGVAVWTCFPHTVPEALESARRLVTDALGLAAPDWIAPARRAWAAPASARRRAATLIWRKPWMGLGPGVFAEDVLRRLGLDNVLGDAAEPYPRVDLDALKRLGPDLVVLPDEPYPFHAQDGPQELAPLPCALVSGRHLTWHGPSLLEARTVLEQQLDAALRA